MNKYFSADYLKGEFELFSPSHVIVLLTLVVLNVLMVVWQRRVERPSARRWFRYALAALLIGQEISLNVWRLSIGEWFIGESLPLHLCGAAIVLSAIMLVNDSYAIYELTYFWGFGGAIQALLTPDSTYGFPHYRFFQVFVSHGAIVTASVYMTFVVGYRPKFRSIWKTFLITNAYAVAIGLFNWAVDGNYLFLCHKPETPSLLDVLGPWPWYILSLQGVGLIFFFVLYAPFGAKDLVAWAAQRRERRVVSPSG
ncbi:MAG: TIGR02206 family membrane protein [Anaerolineae bacterium]|nr:TIGR02206 family membrane protein [Anaerolineae bacterium]